MEPITTHVNCAAQSEFIGAGPASVSQCRVWTNVAYPHIKKLATARSKKKKKKKVSLSASVGKCKFNEIWLENSAFSVLLKLVKKQTNLKPCCMLGRLGTLGIKA